MVSNFGGELGMARVSKPHDYKDMIQMLFWKGLRLCDPLVGIQQVFAKLTYLTWVFGVVSRLLLWITSCVSHLPPIPIDPPEFFS